MYAADHSNHMSLSRLSLAVRLPGRRHAGFVYVRFWSTDVIEITCSFRHNRVFSITDARPCRPVGHLTEYEKWLQAKLNGRNGHPHW